ncbi:hypothetical protein LIER_39826 [Lithospermum erythrorhizon]|uniref:Disease resistance N-terminal domain-containing protein n=1 Tax=Lithospermum erythrorhizon TaxID=34254 RepID=A0AAV3QNF6_LITER
MAEEAVFAFVLETIGKLVVEEGKFLKDQVGELEEQLNTMRWFLREGVRNQEGSGNTRALEWVLSARNIAYEAENLIETYAIKVKSRRGGGVTRKLNRFACIMNECYHLYTF